MPLQAFTYHETKYIYINSVKRLKLILVTANPNLSPQGGLQTVTGFKQ